MAERACQVPQRNHGHHRCPNSDRKEAMNHNLNCTHWADGRFSPCTRTTNSLYFAQIPYLSFKGQLKHHVSENVFPWLLDKLSPPTISSQTTLYFSHPLLLLLFKLAIIPKDETRQQIMGSDMKVREPQKLSLSLLSTIFLDSSKEHPKVVGEGRDD